jgi:hypothetical protein
VIRTENARSFRVRVAAMVAALIMPVAPAFQVQAAEAASTALQEKWAAQAGEGLESRVIDTLQRISSADRRLLALRAYLRAGDTLAERWSWSERELAAYPDTAEGIAASANIDAVAAAFAAANPGFTLEVNRKPRSLELQIAHWNENESVGSAAAALVASLHERFGGNPAPPRMDQLRQALMAWKPSVAVTLAAPGMSAHGQGRAFDFQVARGALIIAGVEAASAGRQWDAAGWTKKLRAAVSAAGDHFTGPLDWPYEPWHYAYSPKP